MRKSILMKSYSAWLPVGWFLLLILLAPTFLKFTERGDLRIILRAAKALDHGEQVYKIEEANEHTKIPLLTAAFIPLSRLPFSWAEHFWDIINLLASIGLFYYLASRIGGELVKTELLLLITTLFLFNPWNTELSLGQTNIFLAVCVLLSAQKINTLLIGFCLLFAALFKPPYLIFFPWIWKYTGDRKKLLVGLASAAGLTVGFYILYFGWDAFLQHHRDWIHFLPLSNEKHISRVANNGLPGFFAAHSDFKLATPIIFVLSFLISIGITKRLKDQYVAFSFICVILILSSPMSWFQNYILLFGFVALLFREIFLKEEGSYYKYGLILSLFPLMVALALNNPEIKHLPGAKFFFEENRIPLYGLLMTLLLSGGVFLGKSHCQSKSV